LTRTDEWAGTSVVFRLVPQSLNSMWVHFEHLGLAPELQCYEICSGGWDHFLGSRH
jgi:hypothetical protein